MYEIERKFLIHEDKLPELTDGVKIKQAYLFDTDKGVCRLRQHGDEYILTLKLKDEGIKQIEVERFLTKEEFEVMFEKTDVSISKTRYRIGSWEIDFFEDIDLILAEIVLDSVNEEIPMLPEWIKKEVTGNVRYFNSNLIKEQKKEQKRNSDG